MKTIWIAHRSQYSGKIIIVEVPFDETSILELRPNKVALHKWVDSRVAHSIETNAIAIAGEGERLKNFVEDDLHEHRYQYVPIEGDPQFFGEP